MNSDGILFHFKLFLKKHYRKQKILLGLSGGPDSLLLFHLLLLLQKELQFSFGIAHINHNWREESTQEAVALRQMVERHGMPFHLAELSPAQLQGNLEDACRVERLNFFKTLCQEHGYDVVLLGHHADDLAETTLKRILEGASFHLFNSLRSVTAYNGITLWRPLLKVRKKEILQWLKENQITPFEDSSNLDPAFLRSRFRTKIIPFLNENFEKEVVRPLCTIAEESSHLEEFLSHLLCHEASTTEADTGVLFDFSSFPYKHSFAIEYVIREGLRKQQITLSREIIQNCAKLILQRTGKKKIETAKVCLSIDKGRILIERKQ